MSTETETTLQLDLTRQTTIPLELWFVIFKFKKHMEYSEWEHRMRYSFSEENCTIHVDEFTTLRSGRKVLYNRNEPSYLHNIIVSCKHLLGMKFNSFHIIRSYYTLVIEYYSWFYKRSWCDNDMRDGGLCVGSQWQRTWSSGRLINYNNVLSVLTRKANEGRESRCFQLNRNRIKSNNMKREIKTSYGSTKRFNNSVQMLKDMIYFIDTYFPNWVSNKLTQCDIQFELRIYNYKSWLMFKNSSKVLRNGKRVGPIIKPMRFYEGN